MGLASSGYCYRLVDNYVEEIESLKKDMTKNFAQMDLQNASVQVEMQEVLDSMTQKCDQLKSSLRSYYFE